MRKTVYLILLALLASGVSAQPVPSADEKIPYLCTFGKGSEKQWGDDDFVQVFFFVVPKTYKSPVYIRLYDPETGGELDEAHANFNTKTKFTVYGGRGAHSDPDAKKQDPSGNYKSGILLATRTFGSEKEFDKQWVSMGPFNPVEGEFQQEFEGYVFKIVIEGTEGDDGNLYRMFMSSAPDNNKPVEGGNAFAYEYSMRMADTKGSVAHLYPFVGNNVVAVKVNIFDYDDDGIVRIVSVSKKGDVYKSSGNGTWMESMHKISTPELNTSLDVQFIKQQDMKNNNIVVYITNQYGELMPFFTSPIGGIPKYTYKIGVKAEN